MKITAEMIHQASVVATPGAWHSESELSQTARVRYTVMADYLTEQIVQEAKARIKRHIAGMESAIEEQQARIRETYDGGVHTNVDPQRAAILKYEQRKLALEVVLDEIS